MQHTDKYNLNIIETIDDFSPEPLNENTRALEARLAALDAAKTAQTDFADLSGRVGTLETGRLLWKLGSYTGNGQYGSGSSRRLEFDFRPIAIIISPPLDFSYGGRLWVRGMYRGVSFNSGVTTYYAALTWGDRTITWYNDKTAADQLNSANTSYTYLVLGTED